MLDSLRNFGRSWIAKVLLGLLVLSMAAFGIPSVFLDLSANTVARVGDRDIGARAFERTYRAQLNQIGAQIGFVPTPEQAVQFGIAGSVLNELASQAALENLADDFGLGVPDEELARLVRTDPNFAGTLGVFDRRQFTQTLLNSGMTEAEYLDIQRSVAYREQMATALFADLSSPRTALEIANRYQNDQRAISYVELNPVLFAVTEAPDEAALTQFFEENAVRYRTEEIRNVRLLVLTPDSLAAGIAISDEEIAARYEQNIAQYTTVERRAIQQLLLPDADTRAELQAALDGGASLAEAAESLGLSASVSNLGTLARTELTDAALADTVFGLAEGEVAFIAGPLGDRAITVTDIQEAAVVPLEVVRDEIERTLQIAEAQQIQLDAYDAIEEARAAFQPFDTVAEQYGLEVYDIALTASGAQLDGIDTLPEGAIATVAQRIFATSETVNVTPAITLGGNSAVFFSIESVEPVRDRTLDEARDEVVADWQELEAQNRMIMAAEDIVAAVDSGTAFDAAVSEAGATPQTSLPFRRSGSEDGIIGQDVATAAFQGEEGYAGYVVTQTGEIVVFQVTDAAPADGEPDAEIAQVFDESIANNLYGGLLSALQQDAGLRVNQNTLNAIIGLDQ